MKLNQLILQKGSVTTSPNQRVRGIIIEGTVIIITIGGFGIVNCEVSVINTLKDLELYLALLLLMRSYVNVNSTKVILVQLLLLL